MSTLIKSSLSIGLSGNSLNLDIILFLFVIPLIICKYTMFLVIFQTFPHFFPSKTLQFSKKLLIFASETERSMKQETALNEAQMSILRLLGSMKTVEEVDELRQIICDYYARKVDEEVDKLWESGQWDNEKNEAILDEHLRTPYKNVP